MSQNDSFFKRFTAIYTDKSINGWVRGAAWIGTGIVIYLVGSGIVSSINAAQVAQQQAARTAELDNQINTLENPSDPNAQAQQPTFSDAQYSNFADAITAAFTGSSLGNFVSAAAIGVLTSAGQTVYNIIQQFQNDVDFFKLQKATRLQILLRLRIPSALPYFFGGLRISSGLALIGAVVAEFVAGTGGTGSGLAYQILQAGFQLNIPRMFASLLLITLSGILLFTLMTWISRLSLMNWHSSELKADN